MKIGIKKYYWLFLIIIFIILAFESTYFLSLKVKQKNLSSPSQFPPEKLKQAQENYNRLAATAAELQKQPISSPQPKNCYILKQDPYPLYALREVIDLGNKVYDYDFNGYLQEVKELSQNGCEYWQVVLKRKTVKEGVPPYSLLFPKDLYQKDESLGKMTAEVLKNFIGQETMIRFRIKTLEQNSWELLEWNFLRFFI